MRKTDHTFTLTHISEPTLLIDPSKVKANIEAMLARAANAKVALRPHFKTHQSPQVGEWFREKGICKIAVSSLRMARYFREHQWQDILCAFPLNVRALPVIHALSEQIAFQGLLSHPQTWAILNERLDFQLSLWIEIDTGYGRTGIAADDWEHLDPLMEQLKKSPYIDLKGFMVHDGHSYQARGKSQILKIQTQSQAKLWALRTRYQSLFPELKISYGDTPVCSVSEQFEGIDEIRPGNFVFYDLKQMQIGACHESQIAVALAAPVVAKSLDKGSVTLQAGAVYLSKDSMQEEAYGLSFGKVASLGDKGWGESWPDAWLSSLSQEHATLRLAPDRWESVEIGDLLAVLPVHACLCADSMGGYMSLEGEKLQMMPK